MIKQEKAKTKIEYHYQNADEMASAVYDLVRANKHTEISQLLGFYQQSADYNDVYLPKLNLSGHFNIVCLAARLGYSDSLRVMIHHSICLFFSLIDQSFKCDLGHWDSLYTQVVVIRNYDQLR